MKDHPNRRQQHREHHFQHHAVSQPTTATEQPSFFGGARPDQNNAQHLGQEQQYGGGREQGDGVRWVPARPDREQLIGLREVCGFRQRVYRE